MRRSWIVLVVWAALVAAAAPFALRQSDHLSGAGYDVRGSQSAQVERLITAGVEPDFRPTALAGVLVATGHATGADYRAALGALADAARRSPGVAMEPVVQGLALEAARQHPGQAAIAPLTVSASELGSFDVARDLRARLGLDDGRHYGGVTLHLVGAGALWAGMLDLTKRDLHHAELLSLPVVAILLLAIFGSMAAATLPLALGLASVIVTGAAIYLLSTLTLMNAFVTNVALMIGLGVAVDYALFVVVRYREEQQAGASPDEARRTAMATSGMAVALSGGAVVIALAGLLIVDTAAIRSLALGAILVVAVAVLACVTLLPALLDLVGRRVGPGRAPLPGISARLATVVLRRPARAVAASIVLLGVLTAPALGLRTGDGALRQLPAGNETRRGFEAAVAVTGPGRGAPLKLLVTHRDIDRTVALLRDDPEVLKVGVRTQTADHRWVLIVATPRHDGDSSAVKRLVRRLRVSLPRGSLVGGNSAFQVDFDDEVSGSMAGVVAWILLATVLLLILALRSATLGIGAVLTNLLSVGAAFGVLTVVFVWGWLDGPLGFDSPGYVDTIAVPVIFAIVFGLSMDYQVFLLTRIRERWRAGQVTAEAVRAGVEASARTITSAAVVMVAVFLSFVVTGVPAVKQIGLGAAVAIAVDATLVRLVLVPAAMTLLGDRCWWMPRGRAAGIAAPAGENVAPTGPPEGTPRATPAATRTAAP
jgi:RND superfamily putative drug exporter